MDKGVCSFGNLVTLGLKVLGEGGGQRSKSVEKPRLSCLNAAVYCIYSVLSFQYKGFVSAGASATLTSSPSSSLQFDKAHAYSIRHMFGKEGKRTDYTPYSCMKVILSNPPSQGDYHGQ